MHCRYWNSRFGNLDQLFYRTSYEERTGSQYHLALWEVNLEMNYANRPNQINASCANVSYFNSVNKEMWSQRIPFNSTYQYWFDLETLPTSPPKNAIRPALSLECDATFFSEKWIQLLVWMWLRKSRENHEHGLVRKEIHKMRRGSLSLTVWTHVECVSAQLQCQPSAAAAAAAGSPKPVFYLKDGGGGGGGEKSGSP